MLLGTVATHERLADLPVRAGIPAEGPRHDLLALVPYRQIRERGFEAHDDATPLQALSVDEQYVYPLAEVLDALPRLPVTLSGGGFDIDDEQYARIVRRVIRDEIGRGEGANFVIRRDFTATLDDFSPSWRSRSSGACWSRSGARTGPSWCTPGSACSWAPPPRCTYGSPAGRS